VRTRINDEELQDMINQADRDGGGKINIDDANGPVLQLGAALCLLTPNNQGSAPAGAVQRARNRAGRQPGLGGIFAEGRRLCVCDFLGCKFPKGTVKHKATGKGVSPRPCGPGIAMQCAGCSVGCMNAKRPARPTDSLCPANQPPTKGGVL